MKFVLFSLLLFSFELFASESCVLTDDYKTARSDAYKIVKGSESPYSRCVSSIYEASYWKAVAACEVEGKGEGIGGGCQHVAGYKNSKELDVSHCEVLKSKNPIQDMKAWLKYTVESNNIVKCKHNQAQKKDADKEGAS